MSFDNLLALTPLPSRSSNASLVFARTAPPEMAFAGVGGAFVYGGYLTALVAKATLESVNPRGYPHILSLTVDVVSGVAGGEELEITVDLPRTTRRLAFARITICPARTPGRPSVLAQSLCGTLSPATPAPSIGQRVSSTLSFSRVRTHVPSLKAPSDGVQDLIALATGLPPPPDAVDKRAQFVTMIHSREALTFAKARIAVGAGELRREGWDGLDAMPFILKHRDGRTLDMLSAAFLCDTFPTSAILRAETGPFIPSVTSSLTVHFYKPFPPSCTFLFYVAGRPAGDVPVDTLDAPAPAAGVAAAAAAQGKGQEAGNIEFWDSAIYAPDGTLVCMQRQTRTVLGPEQAGRMERELGIRWPMRGGKL